MKRARMRGRWIIGPNGLRKFEPDLSPVDPQALADYLELGETRGYDWARLERAGTFIVYHASLLLDLQLAIRRAELLIDFGPAILEPR